MQVATYSQENLSNSISNINSRDNYSNLNVYRTKIEQIMDLKSKAIPISKLLSQILSDAVTFDESKHFELIKLCKHTF